mmetsp:Transcript_8016/g.26258  ORF Transcript_8016/g.26258 Transcript_8016/m.26258 type:complete len:614 (-) Transcript_8016:225-2066(-)
MDFHDSLILQNAKRDVLLAVGNSAEHGGGGPKHVRRSSLAAKSGRPEDVAVTTEGVRATLEDLGWAKALRLAVYARQRVEDEARADADDDDEAHASVAQARLQWEGSINDELEAIARERHVPLARTREGEAAPPARADPSAPLRFLFDSDDLLDAIAHIESARPASGATPPLTAAARGAWGAEPEAADKAFFHVDAAHNLASLLQSNAGPGGDAKARLREAASLYRDVVRADESRWDAWANLGSAMLDAGAPRVDAVKCFQRGIVAAEELENGEIDAELLAGIRASLAQMYVGLGTALAQMGPEERVSAYADADVLLTASDSRDAGGENDAGAAIAESAANALRAAIELAGGAGRLPVADHQLAALLREDAPARASAGFVRALFDDFAETFDDQLVGGLRYRVPELLAARLRDRLAERGAEKYGTVFDAGCGTGLVGPLLRDVVGNLVGADLSEKMCDVARRRVDGTGASVYDRVVVGDLMSPDVYAASDVVAAADVLCYFGALEGVVSLWFETLTVGGDCIFSCENADAAAPAVDSASDAAAKAPATWSLTASGRYAHSPVYVLDVVRGAGFEVVDVTPIIARYENGAPVNSTLYLLTKPEAKPSTKSGFGF